MTTNQVEKLRPFHWRVAALAGLAFAGNGIDAGVVSFALPGIRTEWGLSAPDLGLLTAAFGLGQLFGAIGVGAVADRAGRRVTFAVTTAWAGASIGLAGFARDPILLGGLLFCTGIGFGGIAPVAASLVSEFSPPAFRGRLMAWTQVLWVIGFSVAALGGGWFERELGWRGILALGAGPIGVGVLGWILLPESPRLLVAQGRYQAARELAGELSRRHGIHVPLGDGSAQRPIGTPLARLMELWQPPFRRRTLTLWTTWIAMNSALAGPIYWLPVLLAEYGSETALRVSALVGFAMLPGSLIAVAAIDRFGRRPLMLSSLGIAVLGAVPLAYSESVSLVGLGAAAAAAGNLAAWPVVLAWASEQYPTRMRATAGGWASGFARLGAIGAPTAMGALLGPFGNDRATAVVPFAMLLAAAVIGVAVFAEETTGRTLEELSR